jgi:hypothetical protein
VSSEVQIVVGYVAVIAAIGGYAFMVLRKGRRMSVGMRDEDKPWT